MITIPAQALKATCSDPPAVGVVRYVDWMNKGIDVISPSRTVMSGNIERYREVAQAARENSASWQ